MMKMKQLTRAEFEDFTNTFNVHSLYQTVEYADVMARQGLGTLFVGMLDSNHIVAASLILVEKSDGFNYAYAPRGF